MMIRKFFLRAGCVLVLGPGIALVLLIVYAELAPPPAMLAPSYARPKRVLIRNVNVVRIAEGRIVPRQDVLLESGRIARIGALHERADVTIDGTNRFLMPALWDMHAHVGFASMPRGILPLHVAHGVLHIRDPDGCIAPEPLAVCAMQRRGWSNAAARGWIVGPRFHHLSTFRIDGPRISTAEQARALVREHARKDDVEMLKIYTALPREAFFAVADEAKKHGLIIAGHKPDAVSAIEASNAGMKSIEHSHLFLRECATEEGSRAKLVNSHDPAKCEAIFAALVRNGTWWTPTHVVRKRDAFALDPTFTEDARKKYLPLLLRLDWEDEIADRRERPAFEHRTNRRYYDLGVDTIRRAHRAGVRLLAGTDAPTQVVFPGSGLAHELEVFVAAGLTPAEALRTATLNPAEYVGLARDYGDVAEGKVADLLLLTRNPLENVGAVRYIEFVIDDGAPIDRAQRAAMLAFVGEHAASKGLAIRTLWAFVRSPVLRGEMLRD